MQINIKSKRLSLSENQKEMIHQKVEKLRHLADRLDDASSEFRVEVSHEKSRRPEDAYTCQLTIFAPNAVIRSETRGAQLDGTVEECLQKIKKPISRYKVKIKRIDIKKGSTKPMEADLPEADSSEDAFEIPKIIRRKRFSHTAPLTEEEAIDRMELIGHDFFIFNNADTNRFSVVYKRGDGYYGIIEPKLETD